MKQLSILIGVVCAVSALAMCSMQDDHGVSKLGTVIANADARINGIKLRKTKTATAKVPAKVEYAVFAGGCFWGIENGFRKTPGVIATAVGYSGGKTKNPTYKEVCSDESGHMESVLVMYDPMKVSYEDMVAKFWSMHNPMTPNRQGPDFGTQYQAAVFCLSSAQEQTAKAFVARKAKSLPLPVSTLIQKAATFYAAEDYHQQYDEKAGVETCPIYKG